MTTLSDELLGLLDQQAIELPPSWAFGNSGTRFKVFAQAGVPRDPFEKIADAAKVHELTGLAPSVALHIPLGPGGRLLRPASARRGPRCEARHRQLEHLPRRRVQARLARPPRPGRTRRAIEHHLACVDVMDATGSRDLKIWLADGTNYPGQGDIRSRQDWLAESLATIYDRIGEHQRLVLEYKFFEPAFYHTDVPDWGTAYAQVSALGERAVVCLDTGHHAPGTNIEFIVAQLLRLGKLGSFDFNSRFYADDDLIVGAADPFQLFRILVEVVRGGGYGAGSEVAFMLDQCHNIEQKIPGQIRSVLNVQEMTARALLVDRAALQAAQTAGDVLGANDILMDAFYTDVRPPALADWRVSRGLPENPMRLMPSRAIKNASLPSGSAAPRRAGGAREHDPARSDGGTHHDERDRWRAHRPKQPPRPRPEEHELRRRQHVGEGHRDRPP